MLPRRHEKFASPRRLVFLHKDRLAKAAATAESGDGDDTLQPGYEQLYSYFVPGLQARPYTIRVQQDITAGKESTQLVSNQTFTVTGPRFSLPDNALHSVYPPQGHSDEPEILPHVVFNNNTFPWERVGSNRAEQMTSSNDYYIRNRVPWLAVLVFTEDELKLPQAALSGPTSIFQDIPAFQNGAKQGPTYAVNMSVTDLNPCKVRQTWTPINYDRTLESAEKTDVIFLRRALYNSLFTTYDKNGNPDPSQTTGDVFHHRFLAHRRDIKTKGMALSAGTDQDDSGSFGIVFSHRTGPLALQQPTAVFAHLVSIENVEGVAGTDPWPIPASYEYVAMSSLYSWSYVCLPSKLPNVHDLMANLASTLSVLRPSYSAEDMKTVAAKPFGDKILQRTMAGFTLTRYRTQTGETTACFTRGPFIPCDVNYPVANFQPFNPFWSNCGTDLQIMDPELGIMDITYSSAWQLGRTMAIADQAFTAGLARVRKQIYDRAVNLAQQALLQKYAGYKTRPELIKSMGTLIKNLDGIHHSGVLRGKHSLRSRWNKKDAETFDLTYHGEDLGDEIDKQIYPAAMDIASTPDPADLTQPSTTPYNEENAPFSAEWALLLKWVVNKLFFASVPSHYLITEAAFLPPESLKFFKVDHNWTDAFVDGALSLANHIDQEFDIVRDAMKKAINRFISPTPPQLGDPHPVPAYGCYVRSTLVTKFPDLIVNVLPESSESIVLLRHEIVATDTMLCLFSQPPAVKHSSPVLTPTPAAPTAPAAPAAPTAPTASAVGFKSLIFTQPPHQQTFRAATKITPTTFETDYKRAYTVKDPSDPDRHKNIENALSWTKGKDNGHPAVFLWDQLDAATNTMFGVRTLLLDNFATDYVGELNAKIPQWFNDPTPTAAVMAFELNNPCYMIEMDVTAKPVLAALNPAGAAPPLRTLQARGKGIRARASVRASQSAAVITSTTYHLSPAERAVRNIPLKLAHPPPNNSAVGIGALPVIPSVPLPPIVGNDPAQPPNFVYNFWSADEPGTPDNPGYIPAYTSGLPQDIIFSITLQGPAFSWLLQSISINIKLGNPITSPKQNPGPLMSPPYTGPGASMLSNLRFYPLVRISPKQDTMNITLIPRSSTNQVLAESCNELSFMLSGVVVNCSPASVGDVKVVPVVKEHYVGGTLDPQTPVPVVLLRRTDDSN